MRYAGRLGLVALLLASAATGQPAPLQHSGKWTVSSADGKCSLERAYGPVEAQTILGFIVGPMGTGTELRLLEPGAAYIARSDPGRLVLGDAGGRAVSLAVRSYGPVTGNRRLTSGFLKSADASVRDVIMAPVVTIERGKAGAPVSIAPGGSAEAVQALALCEADLLKQIGIDPAVQQQLSRGPEPEGGGPVKWFKSSDYPKQALHNLRFGRTIARATIAPTGAVEDCTVVLSSGNPDLDATTCAVLRARGRYVPALDLAGKPVAASTLVPVMWMPHLWR